MAGRSASVLASLLVSVASHEHDQPSREQTEQKDDYETHVKCRAATRINAERKAWSLSKHRPALVRWTSPSGSGDAKCSAATSNRRRRARKDATSATAGKNKYDNNSSGSGSGSGSSNSNSNSGRSGDTPNDVLTIFRSGLLSLVSAEGQGRHLVAGAAAIPARTLLLVERPYAWSLQPEFVENTCAECLHEVAGSATLCPDCGSVAFCSIACATAACRTWHGSECVDASGAPLEPAMSAISPTCRAALRALRRAKQNELLEGDDAAAPAVTLGTGGGSNVSSTTVRDTTPSINLVALDEHYTLRPPREIYVMETEAAIAAVLASGDYAGVDAESVGAGERKLHPGRRGCGALATELVTALFKIDTNAFNISTLRCSEPAVGNLRSMTHAKLGIGLYLATAMFNHSCAPNALVIFNGKELRVVATRLIERGEPVTISYGPLASKVASAYERRAALQKAYFFKCNCTACSPEMATPHQSNERTSLRDRAAARSEMTEFACTESGCPGTLLLGVPPPPQKTPLHGQTTHEKIDESAGAAVAPAFSSSKRALWCDCCGTVCSPSSVDALLREDGEDHRLWEEAMAAVAYSQGQSDQKGVSRHHQHRGTSSSSSSSSSSKPPPGRVSSNVSESSAESVVTVTAVAAALVHERASWRDRRLSCRAKRRALAHDAHARLLAVDGNFAGAAEALTRAVEVLANIFAIEDRELGFEYLKLAELCLNAGWAERCMAACQKARVSLEVCLASDDEQLGSLNSMQAVCASYR